MLVAENTTVASPKWTDPFLDRLRQESDPLADEALYRIIKDDETAGIAMLFRRMDVNDETAPAKLFPIASDFFELTQTLPSDVDYDRIRRGEEVFIQHLFEGALALLTKSLPEGYQAANLSIILNISGDLRTHTYRRLLATLQTVVNVSSCRGFQHGGRAVVTAQKLRLLHAAIRHLTNKYRPEFRTQYGIPVNQEDMLGTVLGFSFLVIEGWRKMNVGLTRHQEEDFLYLWITFARIMGIHPAGQPESRAYVPDGLDEADAFYRAFEQRHYVEAERNPDGVELAESNLAMLRGKIPVIFRLFGFGILPRICMRELMGDQACARLDIAPVWGHPIIKWVLLNIHRVWNLFERKNLAPYNSVGMALFQDLIDKAYDGSVTFTVPTSLSQLKGMLDSPRTTAG